MGNARPIDGRPQSEVQVGPDKLEVVASFCYLGDMLSAGGGCEMAITTRVKTAWKKFRELLPHPLYPMIQPNFYIEELIQNTTSRVRMGLGKLTRF